MIVKHFRPMHRLHADSGMGITEMLQVISVADLAVIRHEIRNSIIGDNDSEATDLENMDRLTAIESQIERAKFESEADRAVGRSILIENKPSSWDDFQENLFLRMQKFA
jgi:hypothetical protein